MLRKTVLIALAGFLVGLAGCSSDVPANTTPPPAPQDSGTAKKAKSSVKTVGPRGLPAPVK